MKIIDDYYNIESMELPTLNERFKIVKGKREKLWIIKQSKNFEGALEVCETYSVGNSYYSEWRDKICGGTCNGIASAVQLAYDCT